MRCILCFDVGFLTIFELVWQVKITTSEGGASRKIFWNKATIVVKSVELVNTFHLPTRKCWGNREKLRSFGLLARVCRLYWLVCADFIGSCAQTVLARVRRLYWLVCADFIGSCVQTLLARLCRLYWLVYADFIGSCAQTLLARLCRLYWLVCADFIGSCAQTFLARVCRLY